MSRHLLGLDHEPSQVDLEKMKRDHANIPAEDSQGMGQPWTSHGPRAGCQAQPLRGALQRHWLWLLSAPVNRPMRSVH